MMLKDIVELKEPRYRKNEKGIMSNFDVCANYGVGLCEKKGEKSRPCGKCEQFKY